MEAPPFRSGLFRCIPAPILPAATCLAYPVGTGKLPTRERDKHKPAVSTRSSTRLASKPSSVPVARRAQQKLMRELDSSTSRPLHQMLCCQSLSGPVCTRSFRRGNQGDQGGDQTGEQETFQSPGSGGSRHWSCRDGGPMSMQRQMLRRGTSSRPMYPLVVLFVADLMPANLAVSPCHVCSWKWWCLFWLKPLSGSLAWASSI